MSALPQTPAVVTSATMPSLRSSDSMRLTQDQMAAIDALMSYISDPSAPWKFVFSGYAGTGKTFCMREVVARSSKSQTKFAFATPTNKSAKELRKITGHATTIYSLLGLRVDKTGEIKQIVPGKKIDLSGIDVIILDEGFMVNKTLYRILEQECEAACVKVVFMGDPAQLPPVGEAESPVCASGSDVQLTKVMRHDNQILTLATALRNEYLKFAPCISLKSDYDEKGGVWKMNRIDFRRSIYQAAEAGLFGDGQSAKVIAWRNKTVDEYNQIVRGAVYGEAAVPGMYLPGERIVATGPCVRGDETLMTTDDEAIVESAVACVHPLEPKYKALDLKCRTEQNRVIRLTVIHPDSAELFNNDLQSMAHAAKMNGKLWKRFWEHQELFHTVKYAYALTVHRAQGSTYDTVYADSGDILINRNRREAFQCLYTASTRPRTWLYLT